MVFAFEILREAGVRLPRPVGQAISIVGVLIMGDAAVNAGIVGAPMVIVVAITAVAGFLVPTQNDAGSMLRIIMIGMAAFVGFYGVAFGFLGCWCIWPRWNPSAYRILAISTMLTTCGIL